MKTVARRDDSLFDAWLDDPDRRPLILRGARQVGKTHLVRRLAKRSGRELFELNFQRDPGLRKHFESNDPREILSELSLLRGREIAKRRSSTSVCCTHYSVRRQSTLFRLEIR